MTSAAVLLWLCNIIFDTCGQMAFKAGVSAEKSRQGHHYFIALLTNRWIIIGICCFTAEFVFWLAFLSMVQLSVGVLLASMNIFTVMLAERFLFHEKLLRLQVLGITLVALGVTLVGSLP